MWPTVYTIKHKHVVYMYSARPTLSTPTMGMKIVYLYKHVDWNYDDLGPQFFYQCVLTPINAQIVVWEIIINVTTTMVSRDADQTWFGEEIWRWEACLSNYIF